MNNCVFENDTECNALNEKQCAECTFRKTKEELLNGRRKAANRLMNLSDDLSNHLIRKYYGSIRAFKECCE